MVASTAERDDPGQDGGLLRFWWRGRDVVLPVHLEAEQAAVYAHWLTLLNETGVPYTVGGAYAVYAYTGGWRDSKDLDVFLRPEDLKPALDRLAEAGYETEVRDTYWLAKAHQRPLLLDLLFAVRHTTALKVTEDWFHSCRRGELLGVPTCLLGLEETIATKVYLAARDRFDGADIVHLIRAVKGDVDWDHLIRLLGGDEEVVLWHLLLFDMVYPGHSEYLPRELMERAFERARTRWSQPRDPRWFRGMLFDPAALAVDVEDWGYEDIRDRRPLVDEEGKPT